MEEWHIKYNQWHVRFLELAKHVSEWSKDTTKVGAIIADPDTHQVLGIGYNGFPRNVEDLSERYKDNELKLKLVVHAEVNAILNAKSAKGAYMYVYPTFMMPASCPECAKLIVQSGIKRLYYYRTESISEKWQDLAKYSRIILEEGGVNCIKITPLQPKETPQ